jgi:hypothetical protein
MPMSKLGFLQVTTLASNLPIIFSTQIMQDKLGC